PSAERSAAAAPADTPRALGRPGAGGDRWQPRGRPRAGPRAAPAPRRRRWRPATPIAHTPLVTASWRALPGRGRSARTFHVRPLIRHIPSARFNPFPRLDRRNQQAATPWGDMGAVQGRGDIWG